MRFLPLVLTMATLPAMALAALVHAQAAGNESADRRETLIYSIEGLQAMNNGLAGHYALGQSIDARATADWNGGAGFAPIGAAAAAFTGSFDGRGHVIHGLFIHRPGENSVGLFGRARNATLGNVRLVGGRVTGGENVGALAGHNEAVDGNARIDQACAAVQVTGSENTGGLIGHNEAYNGDNHVAHVESSGVVMATGSNVGGLVGHNEAWNGTASIAHAYARGPVTGRDYVGGLVGYNDALRGLALISHSYASGVVNASGAVAGGLVGLDTNDRVDHSFYATTDERGLAINRFATSAGQGMSLDQLLRMPHFARRHGDGGQCPAFCHSCMTD